MIFDLKVSIYCMKKRIIYFWYKGFRKYQSICCGTEYGCFNVVIQENIKNPIVYSFGIGEDVSFSEAVIERFDAEVYAFDPTPKSIKFVSESNLSNNPHFHFFPYGISDKDEKENFYLPSNEEYVSGSVIAHDGVRGGEIQVEMKSLKTIMQQLGHEKIDILKMDIEGSEFKVIEKLNKEESSAIGQICMEIHDRYFEKPIQHLVGLLKCLKKKNFSVACVGKGLDVVTFINERTENQEC